MNQRTIFFIGPPAKALDVETVSGEAGGLGGTADVVGPRLGAADLDVALGDVGHPPGERGQGGGAADAGAAPEDVTVRLGGVGPPPGGGAEVGGAPTAVADPGAGCPPMAREPQHLQ